MDNGTVAEFDTPDQLLQLENGIFHRLAEESGLIGVKLNHSSIEA